MRSNLFKGLIVAASVFATSICAAAPGTFYVADYPAPADAFTAANANGGGVVFFDRSVTLPGTQIVGDNVRVVCSSPGVVIGTTDVFADLFNLTGNNASVNHCGLAFIGAMGTKTSGFLVNMQGQQNSMLDVTFGPYCFVCVQINNINSSLHDIRFTGNVYGPPAGGLTGAIYCKKGIAHLSDISLYASAAGSEYFFGISAPNCALDMVNGEIITAKIAILQAPSTGDNSFVKVAASYLDNCISYCVLIQPNGGPVGYTTIVGTEMGTKGNGVQIDTTTHGGHIDTVKLIGNTIFQYNSGGFGINMIGHVDDAIIEGNTVGGNLVRFFAAFDVNAGYTGGMSVTGNSFWGAPHAAYLAAVLPQAQIKFNRLNGGILSAGGNSSTNVSDNLP